MARPVGAVDASLKRTYGGIRRGSHHVFLPYLGEPSRKLEDEATESCDSEEEEELDGTRSACVPCEARKQGTDSLPTPGCRPLVEVQTNKPKEAVKPATVTRSRPPLPDNPSHHQQQENLGIPAPLSAHRRQHPIPTLSHRGNAQHAVLAHKFATDGNVSLSNAPAPDSSLSCGVVELERHGLPPSSAQPHSTVLADSSRRQQPTGIPKREAATRPAPELPHCGQGGGGREEVEGHLRGMQEERPVIPPGPDLRSKDWLALPDMNRKKWVLKVSHLGRGGFSEVHNACCICIHSLSAG